MRTSVSVNRWDIRRFAITFATVVALVLSVAACSTRPHVATPSPTPTFEAEIRHTPPIVVFIGDSYSAAGGPTSGRWTGLLAHERGWAEVNLAYGGTGYFAVAGQSGCGLDVCPNFQQVVPKAIEADPDIVIVAGGGNDGKNDPVAIRNVYTSLRAGLPHTQIYAVSPFWRERPIPRFIVEEQASVRDAVTSVSGHYLDIGEPLADDPSLLGPDHVHPNDGGHKVLAQRINQAIG